MTLRSSSNSPTRLKPIKKSRRMKEPAHQRFPWQPLLSELVGTAQLVLVGLSLVTLMVGTGSPVVRVVPDEGLRRLITGFLFDTTGALIVLSPVGKD